MVTVLIAIRMYVLQFLSAIMYISYKPCSQKFKYSVICDKLYAHIHVNQLLLCIHTMNINNNCSLKVIV